MFLQRNILAIDSRNAFVPICELAPVIGIVGGVGSGKSSVARWLNQHHSIPVIDGDQIGHEILKYSSVKQRIQQRFGTAVFNEGGDINRAKLADVVFGSQQKNQQAKADLEKIVHPEIRKEIERQIHDIRTRKTDSAIILDAAVMLEAGWDDLCDFVVFVEADQQQRLQRVSQSRGWDSSEWKSREESQVKLEAKQKASSAVVKNSGTLEEAGNQFLQILTQWNRAET